VFTFHKLFSSATDLDWVEAGCRSAGIGCGDCKMKVGENVNALMAGPRERKKELLQRPDTLDSIIAGGCAKARKVASETLEHVRECTGFKTNADF
jgi:tryptophanyl-tRNA synthetase